MSKRTKLGVILLVISIVLLICLGVAMGFYKQILLTGFDPLALFVFIGFICFGGLTKGCSLL